MNTFFRVATLAALVTVAACASDKSKTDDSTSGSSSSGVGTPNETNSAADSIVGTPTTSGGAAAGVPSGNTLYFQFDSSELSQADTTLVQAWSAYLAANPGIKVRLEGHTDERGTREYNVALGERRGNAVLQALTSRGVSDRQISVSSFGEERPVAMGHDEAAWAQNRRVEIVK